MRRQKYTERANAFFALSFKPRPQGSLLLFRLSLSAIYLIRFYPRYFENGFQEPGMDKGESTTQISLTKDRKDAEVLCLLQTY